MENKNLKRKIFFYPYKSNDIKCYISYFETKKAIQNKEWLIKTNQMCFLSNNLFDLDYRIFICESPKNIYEIKLGKNKSTKRYIKTSHNLFKLWEAGEFNEL